MPDAFDGLLSDAGKSVPSAADLALMGKKASSLYVEEKAPLNDSIVKMASDNPSWTPEHVKRVVEFANQQTYGALFDKEASPVRNITFPLADSAVVLARLEHEARPTVTVKAAATYNTPPDDFRDHLADDEGDSILALAFGAAKEKTAGWTPEDGQVDPVKDWQMKLGGLEHVTAEASGVEVMYDDAVARFDAAVKQAALGDAGLDHIGVVIHEMCGEKTASMQPHLTRCVVNLSAEGVALEMPSEEKLAEAQTRVVDVSSELAQSANYLMEVQDRRELLKYAKAILFEKEASARKLAKAG